MITRVRPTVGTGSPILEVSESIREARQTRFRAAATFPERLVPAAAAVAGSWVALLADARRRDCPGLACLCWRELSAGCGVRSQWRGVVCAGRGLMCPRIRASA